MELGVVFLFLWNNKQKKLLHVSWFCFLRSDKCDALRVAAHERLGEVLRILRIILEHYSALQSTELLVAAGSLIHQVKGLFLILIFTKLNFKSNQFF